MGGKQEKAIARLKSHPKDYTYSEARNLLKSLGYAEDSKGSTSGSRVCFIKGTAKINLHKPHPQDKLKSYAVRDLCDHLEEKGEI